MGDTNIHSWMNIGRICPTSRYFTYSAEIQSPAASVIVAASAANSGRDVVIRMYYRCAAGKEFLNCRVSISVNGRKAQDLFVLSTDIVDPKPLTLRGEGYVDFILPELPLTGGAYFFQSYIESNGHAQDWIKNVAPFSVLDADYYGTGKLCPPGWEANGVLVRYRWEAGETRSTDALPVRACAS